MRYRSRRYEHTIHNLLPRCACVDMQLSMARQQSRHTEAAGMSTALGRCYGQGEGSRTGSKWHNIFSTGPGRLIRAHFTRAVAETNGK